MDAERAQREAERTCSETTDEAIEMLDVKDGPNGPLPYRPCGSCR